MTPAQTYRALQQLARQRGRATDEVLTLYGLERTLGRLQHTRYRQDFVLKGGVLLAAFALRRPTRDVDLQAVGSPVDEEHLRVVLRAVAGVQDDDGLLTYTAPNEPVGVAPIWDEDQYSGAAHGTRRANRRAPCQICLVDSRLRSPRREGRSWSTRVRGASGSLRHAAANSE